MKTKYAVITVVAVLGLATTWFIAEQHKADVAKVIRLKSHGVAVAEVRVPKNEALHIVADNQNLDVQTGILRARGGVTIQLGYTGDSPITIKADEAEMGSIQKRRLIGLAGRLISHLAREP